MDNATQQFNIDAYNKALDEAPANVRRFLWSDEFKQMVAELAKYYGLSDAARTVLENTIFDILIGIASQETVQVSLATLGLDTQKQSDLEGYMYEYFVRPMGTETELLAEIEAGETSQEEQSQDVQPSSAPSPADILSSLKTRLTTPGAIAPAARELPPGPEKKTETPAVKKSIDPYREFPL
jgi:hypothetical protein